MKIQIPANHHLTMGQPYLKTTVAHGTRRSVRARGKLPHGSQPAFSVWFDCCAHCSASQRLSPQTWTLGTVGRPRRAARPSGWGSLSAPKRQSLSFGWLVRSRVMALSRSSSGEPSCREQQNLNQRGHVALAEPVGNCATFLRSECAIAARVQWPSGTLLL